jgi:hypothetical protein
MAPRERRGRTTTRKAAIGGAVAAGVVGLWAGPAAAAWPGTPPTPIAPFPPTAVEVDLTNRLVQGNGSIDAQEIDWYTFVSPKTGEHNISTSTPTSNLDTVLGVYDSAGNRLAYNDDGGFSGDPLDSNLNVTLIAGVRYYFGVTNYINNTTPGAYSWFVRAPK